MSRLIDLTGRRFGILTVFLRLLALPVTVNATTGAAVCLFVLILGFSMTIKGTRKEKESMAKPKFVKAHEKIAEKVVGTFKKMEDTVVSR